MSSENSISEKEEKEHHIQEFNKWNATIDEQLPKLSKPQATVLALWSFGIIIVRSCSISAVKLILAGLFDIKENTIRQRLKEFYLDSNDKKGQKRTQINVRECFVFILKWIIKYWKTKQIALAADSTCYGRYNIGSFFHCFGCKCLVSQPSLGRMCYTCCMDYSRSAE